MTFARKTLTTSLVALTLSATVMASVAPASARDGFRPPVNTISAPLGANKGQIGNAIAFNQTKGVFNPGVSNRQQGHQGRGFGWKGAAALGLGALALGALASAATSSPANAGYAPATYVPECSFERRPIVNSWGQVVGYNRVRICD